MIQACFVDYFALKFAVNFFGIRQDFVY